MNNFSFPKSAFSKENTTKIAGGMPMNMNNDGGRRSLDEIRTDMSVAKGFNIHQNQPQQINQPQINPMQSSPAKDRMQAFKNISKQG